MPNTSPPDARAAFADLRAHGRNAGAGQSGLMVVEGRVEREEQHAEVPIVHLIASRLVDRSDLLLRMMAMGEDGAQGDEAISDVRMPATWDFR